MKMQASHFHKNIWYRLQGWIDDLSLKEEHGIIEQTYQRLNEDRLLLLDLAKKNGVLTNQLTDKVSELLNYVSREMKYHKQFLKDWNNELDIYDSEEDPSKINSYLASLFESINKEIVAISMEVPYTNQDLKYIQSLQCATEPGSRELFSFLIEEGGEGNSVNESTGNESAANKEGMIESSPEDRLGKLQVVDRPDEELSCQDQKILEAKYKEFKDRQHLSRIMLSITDIMDKRIIDYFQLMIRLTRTLGF